MTEAPAMLMDDVTAHKNILDNNANFLSKMTTKQFNKKARSILTNLLNQIMENPTTTLV